MLWCLWLPLLWLAPCAGAVRPCFPGCHCEVETFGLFDSFSLTRVDCSGLGSHIVPVPIPLDTTYLDLSSNQLETVNESMLTGPGYTTLVGLDLSYNRIAQISSATFSRLRYLESLDLSHNALAALPEESFASSPLSELDLSSNRLAQIALDAFTSRGQGKPLHVDLSHNLLTRVVRPHLDRGLPNIQSLNLSWNQLQDVPDLQGLPLRYLNLDGNLLSRVRAGAFSGLKDLTHLSLSGLRRPLELASFAFRDLPSLQVLDLSGNPSLRAAKAEVFSSLNSLQELNLSGTGLAALPDRLLKYLPSVKSITLGKDVWCVKVVKEGQYRRETGRTRKEVLYCHDGHGAVAQAPFAL
ncbi:tsukushi [Gracilinanus agilis]|uniref:tsukushi n=1 Tax=Gracilinanus agilis TaxID=191870 RepID=UPI001CFEE082|nr:tsukushi [Gracilinanus agilis]